MYAATFTDLDMVRYLLSTGRCNINARDIHGQTVLHVLVLSKEMPEDLLTALMLHGSDIEAEDSASRTPFLRAVELNNLMAAQMFRSAGSNIHRRTSASRTALHLAMSFCDERTVSWLVEIGCDVNATDVNNQTPLMILVQEKRPPDVAMQIMRSLVAAGAFVNHRDAQGYSVFLHAVGNPLGMSVQHLNLLISSGCDIDLTDEAGLSPLWQAVFDSGHYPDRLEVIRLLVEENCQLDKECCGKLLFTSGQHRIYCYETALSPFEVAIDSNFYEAAQILFYAGCAVRRNDNCRLSVVSAEVAWLKHALRNVFSLQHLCCISLRRILGSDIRFKVQCLPLPKRIQSCVLLEDLGRLLRDEESAAASAAAMMHSRSID